MKIINNKGVWYLLDDTKEDIVLTPLDADKVYSIKSRAESIRTTQANRAIHLYCKHIADALNTRDLSVTAVLKPEVRFTMATVKEQLFKPILSAVTGKDSTTNMTRQNIDMVYNTMNKALGERFGIHVPFPSVNEMMFERELKK